MKLSDENFFLQRQMKLENNDCSAKSHQSEMLMNSYARELDYLKREHRWVWVLSKVIGWGHRKCDSNDIMFMTEFLFPLSSWITEVQCRFSVQFHANFNSSWVFISFRESLSNLELYMQRSERLGDELQLKDDMIEEQKTRMENAQAVLR